ncbi:MAG: hypothetical protein ACREA2_08915 [Blastocatellia bacterium]
MNFDIGFPSAVLLTGSASPIRCGPLIPAVCAVLRTTVIALYASWTPPAGKRQTLGQKRTFLADADIGLWCDAQGNIILTGEERADYEAAARREAEGRAAHFAAKLRELGVDPDQL